MHRLILLVVMGWLCAAAVPAHAATDYASQLTEGDVVLRDFRFASGEALPELRIHYATLGTPQRDASGRIVNAVMVTYCVMALYKERPIDGQTSSGGSKRRVMVALSSSRQRSQYSVLLRSTSIHALRE